MALALVNRELGEEGSLSEFKIDVVNFKGDSAYVTGQTLLVDGGISTGATRALPKKQ